LTNQYEAMFVFDPAFATEFKSAEDEIRRLMDRAGAEIVFCRRWEERKLAYEIAGHKRGLYVLVYFKADPGKIKGIERDAKISEPILRLLVLRADWVTGERMEHFAPPDRRVEPRPVAPRTEAPAAVEPGRGIEEPDVVSDLTDAVPEQASSVDAAV